jgi:tryptophanyl-tRNA synthetase
VPVGEDQVQHLELSREIVRKFNARFGQVFPEPQEKLTQAARIMGLDDPTRKMSKSMGNTVGLLEDPDSIWEKIRTGVTDPARVRRTDPGEPTKCNIFSLHQYFSSDADIAHVAEGCRTAGIGCIECKKILFDNMMAELAPIRERAQALLAEPERVWSILESGAERCRAIATETMDEVRAAMGLRSPAA